LFSNHLLNHPNCDVDVDHIKTEPKISDKIFNIKKSKNKKIPDPMTRKKSKTNSQNLDKDCTDQ
jgi:hypothetical protein